MYDPQLNLDAMGYSDDLDKNQNPMIAKSPSQVNGYYGDQL